MDPTQVDLDSHWQEPLPGAFKRSTAGGRWTEYQPAWWALRGWVIVVSYQVVYGPQPTFSPFPSESFIAAVGFMVGSVLLGRLSYRRSGRLLNTLVSALALYMAFVAAVNT